MLDSWQSSPNNPQHPPRNDPGCQIRPKSFKRANAELTRERGPTLGEDGGRQWGRRLPRRLGLVQPIQLVQLVGVIE